MDVRDRRDSRLMTSLGLFTLALACACSFATTCWPLWPMFYFGLLMAIFFAPLLLSVGLVSLPLLSIKAVARNVWLFFLVFVFSCAVAVAGVPGLTWMLQALPDRAVGAMIPAALAAGLLLYPRRGHSSRAPVP